MLDLTSQFHTLFCIPHTFTFFPFLVWSISSFLRLSYYNGLYIAQLILISNSDLHNPLEIVGLCYMLVLYHVAIWLNFGNQSRSFAAWVIAGIHKFSLYHAGNNTHVNTPACYYSSSQQKRSLHSCWEKGSCISVQKLECISWPAASVAQRMVCAAVGAEPCWGRGSCTHSLPSPETAALDLWALWQFRLAERALLSCCSANLFLCLTFHLTVKLTKWKAIPIFRT